MPKPKSKKDLMQRVEIAREADRLLKETGLPKSMLAKEAGINYGWLRMSLSPKYADKSNALQYEYLPKIAKLLRTISKRFPDIADKLDELAAKDKAYRRVTE